MQEMDMMSYKNLEIEPIYLDNYKNIDLIKKTFQSCSKVNEPVELKDIPKTSKFFILRSNNDEDIHKSIKYGI